MAGYLTNPGDHIDAPLSNYVAAYRTTGSIADDISPIVPVKRRTDKFYTWDKASFLGGAADDQTRARGAEPKIIEPTESASGYLCREYELSTYIEDADLANTDSVLQLEMAKTAFLADRIRAGRELRVATILQITTTAGGLVPTGQNNTLSGTNQYDNASFAGDSIGDFRKSIELVRAGTGYVPTDVVIPKAVAGFLIKLSAIQTLIQYVAGVNYLRDYTLPLGGDAATGTLDGSPNQSTREGYTYMPANFMGLRVHEPGMVYNSAKEGATFSGADVWGKHIRFLYVNPGPPMMEIPSASYTFRSTEYGTAGWNVRRWRKDSTRSTYYGVGVVDTELLVATDLVATLTNCIA